MFFESLVQDVHYALRAMARNPLFTLAVIFAAALGIGATTAVFSVVDRILFRSLPYPQDDRLVSLGMMAPIDSNEFILPDAYFEWRRHQTPFESITSFTAGLAACDLTEENPLRLSCAQVEANFLPTFGIAPLLGRNFTPQEDRPNAPRVALMSYGLWQRRFGRDPSIVGKIIVLDGQPVTITGILPAAFEMPTLVSADLLIPEALKETERSSRLLRVFARLKPGVTLEQARAAMQSLFEQSLQTVPAQFRREVRLEVHSLRDRQTHDARIASWVLLGAVGFVLLIACANIANLLLARSTGRRRELALRAALGAGRLRLIRQTLTETLLLGLAGGAAGCALAWALVRLFVGIAPNGIPRLDQAALDGRVLLFGLAASLISGLLFGLAPAMHTPNAEALSEWRSTGARRMLLREFLVTAQIAVSLLLLSGAGMLLRSLWRIESVPLGLNPEHVVTAQFTLGRQRYSDPARELEFFNELEARIGRIPGVTASAITDSLPPGGGMHGRPFASIQVEGQPAFTEGTGGMVAWRYVSPGYFPALQIPIVRGQAFEDEDRAVILSESLARRLFRDGDALGKRIQVGAWCTVAGIAPDVRNDGPMKKADPEYYILRKRTEMFPSPAPSFGWRNANVILRTPVNSKIMAKWIGKEFAELDPTLPVTISTMQQRVSDLAQCPRFNAILLSLFAGIGVLLATVGLYGVMAFLVGQRTQEIGVRMALGATPGAIAKLILSRALRWTLAGVILGGVGSLFASRAIQSMLFEVPENDPWTLGVVVPVLLVIALAAAWIPSRRAALVDPISALRHD